MQSAKMEAAKTAEAKAAVAKIKAQLEMATAVAETEKTVKDEADVAQKAEVNRITHHWNAVMEGKDKQLWAVTSERDAKIAAYNILKDEKGIISEKYSVLLAETKVERQMAEMARKLAASEAKMLEMNTTRQVLAAQTTKYEGTLDAKEREFASTIREKEGSFQGQIKSLQKSSEGLTKIALQDTFRLADVAIRTSAGGVLPHPSRAHDDTDAPRLTIEHNNNNGNVD